MKIKLRGTIIPLNAVIKRTQTASGTRAIAVYDYCQCNCQCGGCNR